MYGWTGRCLRVNLSGNKHRIEDINPDLLSKYLGGRGLGVKVFSEEVDPQIDPLDPGNKLIFTSGPLVGTGAVSSASCNVITKSPLTGALVCAKTFRHFGAELKFAGFDMIIIEGRIEHPVILSIMDDKIRLMPALEYWGRSTRETEKLFKESLDNLWMARETYLISIGPAGERLVPLASVVNEGSVALGGAGVGAVMGSKNLKAIAVKGQHSLQVADGNRFVRVIHTLIGKLSSASLISKSLSPAGDIFLVDLCKQKGVFPRNNFQSMSVEGLENIGTEALSRAFPLKSLGCFGCPIACLKKADLSHASSIGKEIFLNCQALGSLGTNCGIEDLEAIAMAVMLCNEMGLDPLTTGGTLATAMELVEKEIITEEDLKLKLKFGDGEGVANAIKLMSTKNEHARSLGQGGLHLAKNYGSLDFFMGVRGHSLPPIDPRGVQGMGLHFATSNLGPHYAHGYTFIDELLNVHENLNPEVISGKAALTKQHQDTAAVMDALGVCNWLLLGIKLKNLVPMVNSCLGTDFKEDDLSAMGERIWNLERLFNLKAGFNGSEDTLPQPFTKEPIPDGPAKGQVSHISEMLAEYYQLRGWNEKGEPLSETLLKLQLED